MTRQSAEDIEEEAADWLARIDRHGQTGALDTELRAWLAGDVRRPGALLQAQAALALLDGRIETMAADRPDPIAEDEGSRTPQRGFPLSRRAWLGLGGGAAIAASIAGAALWSPGGSEDYDTRLGEIRRVPIADGSIATINSQSHVHITLAAKSRTVRIARGEAWFQVAHDPERPFTVEAGAVRVRAVGTAFAVRREDSGANVLVTEGIVDLWCEGSAAPPVRLRAGQRAFVPDAAGPIRQANAADAINRALAWRSGQIDLAGESLSYAIGEFNRYNARKLELLDPRLANEPLYGVFRIDDPEGFANAVAGGFDVRVRVTADAIRIGQ